LDGLALLLFLFTFIVYVFVFSFSAVTTILNSLFPSFNVFVPVPVTLDFNSSLDALIVISFTLFSTSILYVVVFLLKLIFPTLTFNVFKLLFEFLSSFLFTVIVYVSLF